MNVKSQGVHCSNIVTIELINRNTQMKNTNRAFSTAMLAVDLVNKGKANGAKEILDVSEYTSFEINEVENALEFVMSHLKDGSIQSDSDKSKKKSDAAIRAAYLVMDDEFNKAKDVIEASEYTDSEISEVKSSFVFVINYLKESYDKYTANEQNTVH